MSEATKRPWVTYKCREGVEILQKAAPKFRIAFVFDTLGGDDAEANAALIVKAVNNFDQMREALITAQMVIMQGGHNLDVQDIRALDAIKAALEATQ